MFLVLHSYILHLKACRATENQNPYFNYILTNLSLPLVNGRDQIQVEIRYRSIPRPACVDNQQSFKKYYCILKIRVKLFHIGVSGCKWSVSFTKSLLKTNPVGKPTSLSFNSLQRKYHRIFN